MRYITARGVVSDALTYLEDSTPVDVLEHPAHLWRPVGVLDTGQTVWVILDASKEPAPKEYVGVELTVVEP